MARIVFNPAIQLLSGDIAGFVYRAQEDGSVIVAKRRFVDPDRVPTTAQAEHLQRFKQATARCTRLLEGVALKEAYQQVLEERGPTARLRATVIGDILKAPKIDIVDLSGYTGAVGDPIRVVAEDNVGIARLTLVVHDNTSGQDLETAEKDMAEKISPAVEWVYLATAALPDPSLNHLVDIIATAYDLAGNETRSVVSATQ